jgi:glycosyltransferase involved in cell wall biosynthesis
VSGPVRLLHFAEDGDTSGYFPQLARWHDRARFRMSFATLKPTAPWLAEYMRGQGVATASCGCRSRAGYPLGLLRLSARLRRERVAILHAHLFDPAVVGLVAGAMARTPLRVLTRHHSDYHTRIDRPWHVRLDRMCTRLAHAVIAVSRHTAEHLIEVEGAPADKVHVIPNGIDFDRVRLSSPEAPARLRRELGGEGALMVLVPARLHPEKGHPHLFRALARLRGRLAPPLVVLLAGEGGAEAAYRRELAELGVAEQVRFLGFRRDLPDLMAAADLVALPSVAEAFGLVLAEALHLGTPVLATRAGGIPEIVDDGVDGVLVAPGDPKALAGALASLAGDPALRGRLAGAGRAKVRERFAFEAMVRRYEALYETLLARRGAAPA